VSADYQSLMMLLADLNAENRRSPSPAREADLLELRQRAANSIRKAPMGDMHLAQYPADHYFRGQRGLPEIHRDALTLEVLSEGVLQHGALLVRDFFGSETVANLVKQLYGELPHKEHQQGSTPKYGGTPSSICRLIDAYEDAGFLSLLRQYFGEPPLMHAGRAKLRRHIKGRDNYSVIPWHQDVNFFMHKSYALNVWCALNPVGKDNPGLAIVPRRTEDRLAWSGEGSAPLDYGKTFDPLLLERFSADHPIAYPVLAPGDAVLFDEMTLHATAPKPWRLTEQLAAISWFFRASCFPADATAIAV